MNAVLSKYQSLLSSRSQPTHDWSWLVSWWMDLNTELDNEDRLQLQPPVGTFCVCMINSAYPHTLSLPLVVSGSTSLPDQRDFLPCDGSSLHCGSLPAPAPRGDAPLCIINLTALPSSTLSWSHRPIPLPFCCGAPAISGADREQNCSSRSLLVLITTESFKE